MMYKLLHDLLVFLHLIMHFAANLLQPYWTMVGYKADSSLSVKALDLFQRRLMLNFLYIMHVCLILETEAAWNDAVHCENQL